MTRPFIITTSWDDGDALDMRVADLLDKYGMKGTFYVAREFMESRLSDVQIRALAARHEIGAHTLTHPELTNIPPEQARQEIAGSKTWLEDVTGKPITSFAYPKGMFNPAVREMVADSGFTVARTGEQYTLTPGKDPFTMTTTLHIYPYPLRPMPAIAWYRGWWARWLPLRRAVAARNTVNIPLLALRSRQTLAKSLLDNAAENSGVWHLWGHSWEVERYHLWRALDDLLALAALSPAARTLTNTEAYQASQSLSA